MNVSAGLPRQEFADGCATGRRLPRTLCGSTAAREKFRAAVGTIYAIVATSHLYSLASAPNRELSIASVSTFALSSTPPFFRRLSGRQARRNVYLTARCLFNYTKGQVSPNEDILINCIFIKNTNHSCMQESELFLIR